MQRETQSAIRPIDAVHVCSFWADFLSQVPSVETLTEQRNAMVDFPIDIPEHDCATRAFPDGESTPDSTVVQKIAVDWTFVFRGMDRSQGPKPPYAGVWLSDDGVGLNAMFEVHAAYAGSGLKVTEKVGNRLDYLGTQCDYLGWMFSRYAQESGADGGEETADRIRTFMDRYMLNWLPLFEGEVVKQARTEYVKHSVSLLSASLFEVRTLV